MADDVIQEKLPFQIKLRVSVQAWLVFPELGKVEVLNSITLAKTCLLGSRPPWTASKGLDLSHLATLPASPSSILLHREHAIGLERR